MSENHSSPLQSQSAQSIGLAGGAPPPAVAAVTVVPANYSPRIDTENSAQSNWMAGSSSCAINQDYIESASNGTQLPTSDVGVSPVDPPPGLLNVGETCYLNSIVQILYHIPAFREAVLSYEREPVSQDTAGSESPSQAEHVENKAQKNAEAILDELKRLFNLLRTTTRRCEDPSELVDMLRNKNFEFEFQADGQQDAHEFLRFLLENVATAMEVASKPCAEHEVNQVFNSGSKRLVHHGDGGSPRPKKRPRPLDMNGLSSSSLNSAKYGKPEETIIDSSDGLPPVSENHGNALGQTPKTNPGLHSVPSNVPIASKAIMQNGGRSVPTDTNAVRRIFQGESVTCTKCCECETRSNRPESFLDLSVPVRVGYSLSGLLTSMAARDMLTGTDKYACEVCNTKTEAERRFMLSKMPPVFTVHLKLFQFTAHRAGAKIPVATPCPFRMRFDDWCTEECSKKAPWYHLTGIIVHTGGYASSGHYVAYLLKREFKQWYCFDDSIVSPVTEQTIEDLLLYKAEKSRKTNYICFYTAEEE